MPKIKSTTTTPETTTTPAIASIRDGGIRAAGLTRDLVEFGHQMLAVWPALAADYASGDAKWANFDAGAADDFDARHPATYVAKNAETGEWSLSDAASHDAKITAAWLKARDRKAWAALKTDNATLYAIASPINRDLNVYVAKARSTLKLAVSKALAATASAAVKSGNRTIVQYVADVCAEVEKKVKTGLSNENVTPDQAKAIREWIAKKPTL